MPLNIRWLLAFGLAISIAGSLPVDAKRKHAAVTQPHHSSVVQQKTSSHKSSSKRRSSTSSVANVKRSGSSRASGKHSIIGSRQKRGRGKSAGKTVHVAKHHAQPKPVGPEPHADYVQDSRGLADVYRLYDRGVNERLEGRYEQATKTLLEATNTYSSTKKGLTLEAMIDYELGQAAEANNNYSVAADAYTRTLRIKPTLIEAAVRLASMLMKVGQPQAALSQARETVALNPMDPRAHQILALILDKNGFADDAKAERETAGRLVRSGDSVFTDNVDRTPTEQAPTTTSPPETPVPSTTPSITPSTTAPITPSTSPSTTNQITSPSEPIKPKPPTEPIDSDVMP